MKLDELLSWYQKKIGTYDKQQWEKTIEQKILDGFTNVTLKTAKLKTELIDVDLVRGSSFSKAKPKQTLLTVIRLAILRYYFLPLYAKWWVKKTSPKIFAGLLCVYVTQLVNWGVYSFNVHKIERDSIVSMSEILIPMSLSLILSLIHSLIVATSSSNGNSTTAKRKQQLFKLSSKRERAKLLRHRSKDTIRSASHLDIYEVQNKKLNAKKVHLKTDSINTNNDVTGSKPLYITKDFDSRCPTGSLLNENVRNYMQNSNSHHQKIGHHIQLNYNLPNELKDLKTKQNNEMDAAIVFQKRSQILNNLVQKTVRIDDSVQEFYDDLIQQTDESINDDPNRNFQQNLQHDVLLVDPVRVYNPLAAAENPIEHTGDDDGFESLNGKSSSGEENKATDQKRAETPVQQQPQQPESRNILRNRKSYKNSHRNDSDVEADAAAKEDMENSNRLTAPQQHATGQQNSTSVSFRRKVPLSSESDFEKDANYLRKLNKMSVRSLSSHALLQSDGLKKFQTTINSGRVEESTETEEDGDDGELISSPTTINNTTYTECTTSATEWLGITTNSEECSNASELEQSDFERNEPSDREYTPPLIFNPPSGSTDRISCTIWDRHDAKKAEMSVLDISSCIIDRVEAMAESYDYIYIGVIFGVILSFLPSFCRLCEVIVDTENNNEINYLEIPGLVLEKASFSFWTLLKFAFGETGWETTVLVLGFINRLILTFLLFFLLTVAERTFKQRFLYAKLFSHITSSRRARKSNLPHFRLNKVRNIKTWLSVRSYLKRRGPQRSVDVIVSSAFVVTFLLLSFLCLEWLKDSVHLHSQLNLEALLWSTTLGIFLLRFMTLGTKTNIKYRSTSVLITEQINLYLQIEQNPKKKEALVVSNSVLKLAADLLKELESPFKISGLSANPYLYTTIKVVILSALSGVLSEMLGFKLKLNKIKIK